MKIQPMLVLTLLLGAAATAAAADAPPKEVILFKADSISKPGALLANSDYKVMMARRDRPGQVEIHTRDTDVFYIISGSAIFVTGGTCPGAREVQPYELRGDAIVGGTERHLTQGDVIVIPHGTPHQFVAVDGPFHYFVVKVTE